MQQSITQTHKPSLDGCPEVMADPCVDDLLYGTWLCQHDFSRFLKTYSTQKVPQHDAKEPTRKLDRQLSVHEYSQRHNLGAKQQASHSQNGFLIPK